jgi:hypothetical protein
MHVVVAKTFPGSVSETDRVAVANSVARVVDELIPGDPPMGRRPIEISFGAPPRVLWTGADFDGPNYRIQISSQGTNFQQFAYQLAHELGHIKLGPARSNHLLEVFAEMVSLTTIKRLGNKWRERASYKHNSINWSKLASTRMYLTSTAEQAVRHLPASIAYLGMSVMHPKHSWHTVDRVA